MKRLDHVLSRLSTTGVMLPTDAEELSVLRMRISITTEKEYLACMEKDLSFKEDVQDKLLLALHKERQENLELHRKVEIFRAFFSEKREQEQEQEQQQQSIISAAAAPEASVADAQSDCNIAVCNTSIASEYDYLSTDAPSPIATPRRHSVSF